MISNASSALFDFMQITPSNYTFSYSNSKLVVCCFVEAKPVNVLICINMYWLDPIDWNKKMNIDEIHIFWRRILFIKIKRACSNALTNTATHAQVAGCFPSDEWSFLAVVRNTLCSFLKKNSLIQLQLLGKTNVKTIKSRKNVHFFIVFITR